MKEYAEQVAKSLDEHEFKASNDGSVSEDETSHMLTTVYRKCLDLKIDKRRLNTKQTVLKDFFCFRLVYMNAYTCHKLC